MKKRHFSILLLIVILLTNSIAVFADSLIFTDIKDHWAKEFIEDIYNRKITQGYTDATFKPSNSITNLETSVMLANMLKFNADNSLLLKYETVISQNNIPAWAQGHIAYLLDKGVLLESEVKTFVSNGVGVNAKRHEVATYIGRVLVELGGKSISRSYYIPYKDELSIPNDAKPYIDLLLSLEILNKESNDGQFLPNNNITRAETAKLMALTAKILDGAGTVIPDSNSSKTVDGVINNIVLANRTVLTIYDEDNNINVYDVKDNAIVIIDNKNSTLANLEKGQTVRLKVVSGVVEEINAIGNKEIIEGYFQRVFDNEGNTMLTVKDLKGEYKYYTIVENTKVYLDSKIDEFKNIQTGDYLKVYVNGSFVYEVDAKSKTKTIKGIISTKGAVSERRLEITQKDETEVVTLVLETTTIIKRDGRVVTFNDLKVGDEVTAELEYDVIKNLISSSVRRTLQGTIKKIVNDPANNSISVESKSLDLEEFIISDDVIIFIDNVVGDFYDLRLNYTVLLNIDGNEVTSIITSKKVEPETVIGKVKSINRDINVMTVTVDQSGTTKEMQVHVKNTTTFIGKTGGTWHFSLIKEGDQLLLTGTLTNGAFILEKVIVIN